MFELTHPHGRKGKGYRNLGLDRKGDSQDAEYRLCAQCGWPCLLSRDAHGNTLDSPGLEEVTTRVTVPTSRVAEGYVDKIEKNVISGCPNCGSHNYEGTNRLRPRQARNARTRR